MIKEYRKKETIMAEQFDGSKQMIDKYKIIPNVEYYADESEDIISKIVPFQLETLEGIMTLEKADWIATGSNGEHWAIRDDIFKKTYEEVKPKGILYYASRQKNLSKKRYEIFYSQKFNGEILNGSYTKTIKDESELRDIADALYSDPHVFSVRWERKQ